jgi:hypothetical protein
MFCHKLGRIAIETHERHETIYMNKALSSMHMSEWFKKFRGRCRYLKDDPESGDLSTA